MWCHTPASRHTKFTTQKQHCLLIVGTIALPLYVCVYMCVCDCFCVSVANVLATLRSTAAAPQATICHTSSNSLNCSFSPTMVSGGNSSVPLPATLVAKPARSSCYCSCTFRRQHYLTQTKVNYNALLVPFLPLCPSRCVDFVVLRRYLQPVGCDLCECRIVACRYATKK